MNNKYDLRNYRKFDLFTLAILIFSFISLTITFIFEELWVFGFLFNCISLPLILSIAYFIATVRSEKWFDLRGIIKAVMTPTIVPIGGFLLALIGQVLMRDPKIYKMLYFEYPIYLYMLFISVFSIVIGLLTLIIVHIILLLRYKFRKVDVSAKN